LMEEDLCVTFARDEITHEFLLSGLGQAHIETVVARMKNRFKVEVLLHAPKVPYKETIKTSAEARGRHKKQSGGRGQFGDCWVKFAPRSRGEGYEFVDKIVGGSIPRNFIPAVDKGIRAALKKGFLAGFPMVDVQAICYDGSYHAVDSSEHAFNMAGSNAFKEAVTSCKPTILEPVMKMEITVPRDHMGDIIGDITRRRGRVAGFSEKGRMAVVNAQAPMSEVLSYTSDLKSMTSERGSFTMEMAHYDEVPPEVQQRLIAASKTAE